MWGQCGEGAGHRPMYRGGTFVVSGGNAVCVEAVSALVFRCIGVY